MSFETNQLVGQAGRYGAPAGAAVALVLAATMFFHHNGVHAAMISSPAPLDDNSVSSLVALDSAVEAVATRVSPAIVNIQVTSRGGEHETSGEQDQSQQQQIEHGIGSGVIISSDGYIVTNNHVVDGAMQMRVMLNDRRVLTAKLVGVDKLTDLAVIK